MQTKNAIGNLKNRYIAVLKKCRFLNALGTIAIAGTMLLGCASMANANDVSIDGIGNDTSVSMKAAGGSPSANDLVTTATGSSGTFNLNIDGRLLDVYTMTIGNDDLGGDLTVTLKEGAGGVTSITSTSLTVVGAKDGGTETSRYIISSGLTHNVNGIVKFDTNGDGVARLDVEGALVVHTSDSSVPASISGTRGIASDGQLYVTNGTLEARNASDSLADMSIDHATVTLNGAEVNVASLTLDAFSTLTIQGNTTTFNGALTVMGTANVSASSVYNGAATFADGLNVTGGSSTFKDTGSITGTTVVDNATFVVDALGKTVTAADMGVNANASLNVQAGTLDVSGGALTVNNGATSFATSADATLIVKAMDFGTIAQNGDYTFFGTVEKELSHAGNLILTDVGLTNMTYADYGAFLTQFYVDALEGSSTGTVELKDVLIDTNALTLSGVVSGTILQSTVVLGDLGTPADGVFAAGRAAVLGGVNGNAINNGTLTLTGSGDANGVLVAGNLTNNHSITLENGSVNGIFANTKEAIITGTVTAGATTSTGVGNTFTVQNGALYTASAFTADGDSTIRVDSSTFVITDGTTLNGGTLRTTSSGFGNGIQNASTSFLHNLNKIDGAIVTENNAYTVLGGDATNNGRAYAGKAYDESKQSWGTGVTAALFIATPQILENSGSLQIDGSNINIAAAAANSAKFAANSLFVVDAAGMGTGAALTANGGTLTVASAAKLHITGATGKTTVHIVDGFTNGTSAIATGGWDADNLTTSSSLQVLKVADFDTATGSYAVQISGLTPIPESVDKLLNEYPQMQRQTAELLVEFSQASPNVNDPEMFKSLFARIFDAEYIGATDPWLAAITAEGLLQLGMSAGTASNAMGLSGMTVKNLHARLNAFLSGNSTNIAYRDDIHMQHQGVAAGSEANAIRNGFAVWATPFYSHTDVSGFDAGSFESGVTSDLGGLSMGADYTINSMYRFGLAVHGGGGSAESNGDFNTTTNDFGFGGASLYGAMYYTNFALTADVGYTFVNNDVEMALPTSLGYSEAKTDMDSNVFTLGAEASYLFETQLVDVMPHLGLRYTNVHTSAYDVQVEGATVVDTKSDSQDIFSIPVGVTFSKDFTTANAWNVRPSLDLGMTYSFGDLEASSTSSIPTVVGSTTYNVENVDRFAFNGGIGLEMAKDNVSFGMHYDVQASRHETSHGLQATFRYAF